MNDLLFYALLIALLYYFLVYLPHQKNKVEYTPWLEPLTDHQSTQTETPSEENNQELEKTLDHLIKSIKEFKQELDHPKLAELQTAWQLAQAKLQGKIPWEDWETKEGLTNYLQELTQQIKALTKKK